MKRNMTTILLFVVLFVGLALLLYPSVSDFYNSFHQSRAVATYNTVVEQESKKDYEADWAAANAYNEKLRAQSTVDRLIMTDEEREEYDAVMNVGGSGIIGVIEIPQIAVTLPLYHSTNANVLQVAVGHIEGTSLPTGEPGTHSAFSAHRGLPSAKLFTNLDQLTYGDTFTRMTSAHCKSMTAWICARSSPAHPTALTRTGCLSADTGSKRRLRSYPCASPRTHS